MKEKDPDWRPLIGHEKTHEISTDGRIKRLARSIIVERKGSAPFKALVKEKILKPTIADNGYEYINIPKDGKQNLQTVHSLVAETFIGPRPPGLDVGHADGTRVNNKVDNLYYCTRKENLNEPIGKARYIKAMQERGKASRSLPDEKVRTIKESLQSKTPSEIALDLNVPKYKVVAIKNGRTYKDVK